MNNPDYQSAARDLCAALGIANPTVDQVRKVREAMERAATSGYKDGFISGALHATGPSGYTAAPMMEDA